MGISKQPVPSAPGVGLNVPPRHSMAVSKLSKEEAKSLVTSEDIAPYLAQEQAQHLMNEIERAAGEKEEATKVIRVPVFKTDTDVKTILAKINQPVTKVGKGKEEKVHTYYLNKKKYAGDDDHKYLGEYTFEEAYKLYDEIQLGLINNVEREVEKKAFGDFIRSCQIEGLRSLITSVGRLRIYSPKSEVKETVASQC